jgi:hypothetical protein
MFGAVYFNPVSGMYTSLVNTSTTVRIHKVYIHAKHSKRVFAYLQPIKVEIDFPCENDEFYLNADRADSEDPAYFMKWKQNTRFMFTAPINSMELFEIDLSQRFIKLSPENKCLIQNYTIHKVLTD